MSLETQIENSKPQIKYFQNKYGIDSEPLKQRSHSPKSKTKSQQSQKRAQSGKIKFKVNSHNFLQKPKELLGGGFYKRSEIHNSVPFFKQDKHHSRDDDFPLFPQIENHAQYQNMQTFNHIRRVKVNSVHNNLAQIQEETDDIFNPGLNRSSRHKDSQLILSLQKDNIDLQRIVEEQNNKQEILNSELYQLQTKSMADQVQYYLQGAHHCHFEEQTFELINRLRLNDEILARIRAELEKVIGMVKNYNTEGLLSRILDLEQLIKDLDSQRSEMIIEIEMLGLQRDDWHEKHSSVQNRLINLTGTDQKLIESEKKGKMQGETLEKLNRRLKERQIEIQDWQRKCSTIETEKNKRVSELEAHQRDLWSQLSVIQQDFQLSQTQLNQLQIDTVYKSEMLDEEKRKTKQLHSEILDLRVNRITGLQEEIAKQKKVIQLRVEEIEELEVKVRQLNRKIEFLETQIRTFEEVAQQKLNMREQEWMKKFKEFEKQAIQMKQEINLMGIQIQEKDIFIALKIQECDESNTRIQALLKDIEQGKQIQQKLLNKITENEETIEQKNYEIQQLEEEIVNWRKNNEEQLQIIKEFEIKTVEDEKIIKQQETQIESYKTHLDSLNRHVESLKLQIESQNQLISKERQKYQDEVHKVELERDKNKTLREDIAEKELLIQQQKDALQILQDSLKDTQMKVTSLELKIIEIQENDKFISGKLKKQLEQMETFLTEEKLVSKNLQNAIEAMQAESAKNLLLIEEKEQKINTLQADKLKSISQIQQLVKKEKQLTDQNVILIDRNTILATAEQDLRLYKEQVADFARIMKEHQMVKDELQKSINENEAMKLEQLKQQQKLEQAGLLHLQENETYQQTIENQTKQSSLMIKQLKKNELELLDAQHKLEILMNAMEGMNDEGGQQQVISKMNKKPEVIGQTMEKVKQVFVDEKTFKTQGEQIQVKFEDLQFDTAGGAHLTIAFWVRVGPSKLKEAFPIIKIVCSRSKQILLELGVHLDSGSVYATYYPKAELVDHVLEKQTQIHRPSTSPSKVNDNMLTVTSQLSIRLDQFQHIALTLNEYGSNMDMGLCLNGVRDDQVSVSRSILLPEAVLIFGCHPDQLTEDIKQQSQSKFILSNMKSSDNKFPKFIIKDALVFTKSIQSVNIFKQITNYFNSVYNQFPDKKIKQKVQQQSIKLPQIQIQQYQSSGDLVYNLLQQEMISKPHQKQSKREISPRHVRRQSKTSYQVNRPVSFRGRMIPSNLVDTCDLLREQSESRIGNDENQKTASKLVSEHQQIEEEKVWSRSRAILTLQSTLDQDFALRGLLRPIVQHYFYICQTLQLMSPPFFEGAALNSFQSHLNDVVGLIKLPGPQYFIISLDSFIYMLEYCGLQKINQQQLLDVCNNIEIIINKNNQNYLHYDHLMIILREVVMNKAQATIMKYEERKQNLLRNPIQENEEAETFTLEENLEVLLLSPSPDNWNLGKFTLILNRCRGCEKHAHTTRHQEQDFIEKSNQLQGSLRESFPNIEIQENVDKMARLECFELYIKGVGNKAYMDKEGRFFLFLKNESVPKFQLSFDTRLPRIYEKLALIISVYETTHKMGDEQIRLLKLKSITSL